MTSSMYDAYPPHVLAQKLNNRGAELLESRRYEKAITALVKALRITERLAADSSFSCCCRYCALDTCISTCCTATKQGITKPQQDAGCCSHQKVSPLEVSSPQHSQNVYDDGSNCGYLYSKPIYVSDVSLEEGHEMGITLSLIVIYNLALAHQLSAMQETPQPDALKLLEKASQLYELAYQLQLEQGAHDAIQVNSLRFTMIVANNLGEIHRVVNDHTKHVMCLQHLLSTMMYLIDCQYPADYIELEGFLRNTSHLVLQRVCANAA